MTKVLAPWEITCKTQFVPFIIPLMLCMYAFGIKLSYFCFFIIPLNLHSNHVFWWRNLVFFSFEILDWIKDNKGGWLVLNHLSSMLNYNKCVVMSSIVILACKFLFKKSKLKLEAWYLITHLTNVWKVQKGLRFVPFFVTHLFISHVCTPNYNKK